MPRTCQWPTSPDDMAAFLAGVTFDPCGTRAPSFQAAPVDFDADDAPAPIDVCDVHKPAAEAATWKVRPYLTTRTRSRLAAETRAPHDLVDTTLPPPDPDHYAEPLDDAAVQAALLDLATDPVFHELDVLQHIATSMASLADDDARRRVATWVADRYGAPI